MPLYEFECSSCGERFEKLMAAADKVNTVECPKCDSRSVERIPSAFAVGVPSMCGPCPGGQCGMNRM